MDIDDEAPRSYDQYCPITRAVEVLGERWSLLIVRDMLYGFTRFNELGRGTPGLSRTLLSKRLRQLQNAGIVEHIGGEYLLTKAGEDLRPIVFGLGAWGARWQFGDPREAELDPQLLIWWVHRRLDFSAFGDRRAVLAFRFHDERERYWIVHDARGHSIYTYDPGFGVDATIESDLATLYQVWLGRMPLRTALRDGSVVVDGTPGVVRRISTVLRLSPMAPAVTAAMAV